MALAWLITRDYLRLTIVTVSSAKRHLTLLNPTAIVSQSCYTTGIGDVTPANSLVTAINDFHISK